ALTPARLFGQCLKVRCIVPDITAHEVLAFVTVLGRSLHAVDAEQSARRGAPAVAAPRARGAVGPLAVLAAGPGRRQRAAALTGRRFTCCPPPRVTSCPVPPCPVPDCPMTAPPGSPPGAPSCCSRTVSRRPSATSPAARRIGCATRCAPPRSRPTSGCCGL